MNVLHNGGRVGDYGVENEQRRHLAGCHKGATLGHSTSVNASFLL